MEKSLDAVKTNLNARLENMKGTLKGIVSDFRAVGEDVKNRVIDGTEPQFSKQYPGRFTGKTGSLPADVIALPTAIIDRIEGHILEFAKINRRWLRESKDEDTE